MVGGLDYIERGLDYIERGLDYIERGLSYLYWVGCSVTFRRCIV